MTVLAALIAESAVINSEMNDLGRVWGKREKREGRWVNRGKRIQAERKVLNWIFSSGCSLLSAALKPSTTSTVTEPGWRLESCPLTEHYPGADLLSRPQKLQLSMQLRACEYKSIHSNVGCCRSDSVIIWMWPKGSDRLYKRAGGVRGHEGGNCQLEMWSCQ